MERLRSARILLAVVLVTLALLPFHLLALALSLPMRKHIPVLWHRSVAWVFGIKIHVHGCRAQSPHGVMLAANHVSWLDILALGATGPVSFIAKDDVAAWPVFGWLAKWQETIFIARDRRASTRKQISAIGARLDDGDTLLLFPEGTTSDGNVVYPFKSAHFGAVGITGEAANGHPIVQPVAIAYTRWHGMPMGRFDRPLAAWPGDLELIPHLTHILRDGVLDVDVVFGAPTTIAPGADRKALTRQMEHEIRTMVSAALRGRLASSKADMNALHSADDDTQ